MKRHFPGLNQANASSDNQVPGGMFLVRVEGAQYRWHAKKPYFLLRFAVLAPKNLAGQSITGRIHCTDKAMWKLAWFLRDFGYDSELIEKGEIEEKALIGLLGVVKINQIILQSNSVLNLEGFAEAKHWEQLSAAFLRKSAYSEAGR
jgi:hypothetical protein